MKFTDVHSVDEIRRLIRDYMRVKGEDDILTALGFTPEDVSNKITSWGTPTDTQYPSAKLSKDTLDLKATSAGLEDGSNADSKHKHNKLYNASNINVLNIDGYNVNLSHDGSSTGYGLIGSQNTFHMLVNCYFDGNWKFKGTGYARMFYIGNLETPIGHLISSVSGTQDQDISWNIYSIPFANGSANTKLFMNNAGTGWEWANDSFIVDFTIDPSSVGSQSITGVPFKPSSVEIYATNFLPNGVCHGFADAAGTTKSLFDASIMVTSGVWDMYLGGGSYLLQMAFSSGYFYSTLTSWDSSGMTISNNKSGTPSDTIFCSALFRR